MGGFFGGGSNTSTTTSPNVSPAQENLINALAPQQIYGSRLQTGMAGMGSTLLEQMIGRMLGVNYGAAPPPAPPPPAPPPSSGPPPPSGEPPPIQPGDPGWPPPNPMSTAGGVGATSDVSAYHQGVMPRTGDDIAPPQRLPSVQNPYPGPTDYDTLGQTLAPPGQSPISALYAPGQGEMAYPGAVANVTNPLINVLQGQFGTSAAFGPTMMGTAAGAAGRVPGQIDLANYLVMQGMQPGRGPAPVSGLPTMTGLPPSQFSSMTGGPGVGGPNYDALLAPMLEQWGGTTLPGIQGQAIGAGAFGGSAANNLVGTAAREQGLGMMSAAEQYRAALENARTGRLSAITNQYGAETNQALGRYGAETNQALGRYGAETGRMGAETGQMGTMLQGALGAGQLGSGLAGTTGQLGVAGTSQTGNLANVLQQMGLAAPGAQSNLDTLVRQLGISGAQAPLQLIQMLMGGASGIPSIQAPLAPPGQTQTQESGASAGAQAGQAISSLLPLLLMAFI